MKDPIKKYNSWLLEDKSKRFVEKEGATKVVFKPIDDKSFLVKYKKLAVIDAERRLIGQPTIMNDGSVQYPASPNSGWSQTANLLITSADSWVFCDIYL